MLWIYPDTLKIARLGLKKFQQTDECYTFDESDEAIKNNIAIKEI